MKEAICYTCFTSGQSECEVLAVSKGFILVLPVNEYG